MAIPTLRRSRFTRLAQLATGMACMALLGSCTQQDIAPPPAVPSPPPVAIAAPPAPPPAIPVRPAPRDWRDAPPSPGDWQWRREGAMSVARFGDAGQPAVLMLACVNGAISLLVPATRPAAESVAVTVTTSTQTRALSGLVRPGAPALLEVRLAARDPLLDAMALSNGRFRIEVEGGGAIMAPAWPEVTRVVEDCRAPAP